VSLALVIQHAMRMARIVTCGLSGSTIFFPHYLINVMIFENKLSNINVCSDFLYNVVSKHFSFQE